MSNSGPSLPAPGFVLGLNEGMFALLATAILLVSAALWAAHAPNAEKTDFSLTYVGAKIVHQGLGRNLYDPALQKQLRDSLFQHPSPLFFEHPPFEALVLSPLAALPFRTAYMIYSLFNAMVWVLMIFLLRPYLPWPREGLGYLSLWLLFAPLGVALYQGQSSLLLLALYAITFVQLKRGKDFAAGVALGFGLLKFQFVLPFALIFLVRKKWRFLRGFVSTSLFLELLSIAAVGWKGIQQYVRFLLTVGSNPQNVSYGSGVDMPTIHGFVYAILGQRIGHTGLNIIVASSSLLLFAFVAARWQSLRGSSSFDLMFAAAVATSLVTGSHMFTHDFSPLVLAMFLAMATFSGSRAINHRAMRITMTITVLLFWAFPIYFLFVAWHCLYLMCPLLLLFAYSALLGAKYLGLQRQAELECVTAG
jgi:glycosyl transferase family 87